MNSTSESSKLEELRAKTDRQLMALITNRLNQAFAFLSLAARQDMRARWASNFYEMKARRAWQEARVLLPCVRDLPPAERLRFEEHLGRLGQSIDAVSQTAWRVSA